ncbi:hypothetical protein SLS57_005363 [Botryosphaeria dothidea]
MSDSQLSTSKRPPPSSLASPPSKRTATDSVNTAHPVSLPRQSHRATINDLPDELLDEILGYFHIHSGTRTFVRFEILDQWRHCKLKALKSLVLVSKRLQRIAEPHLHHAYVDHGIARHQRRFVNRLIDRPDLAKQLTIVYLDGWASERPDPRDFEDERLRAAAASFEPDAEAGQRFADDVASGRLYAPATLLFLLARNVAFLDIECSLDEEDALPTLLRERPGGRVLPLLDNLRHLALRHADDEGGIDSNALAPFLRLPRLRAATLWMAEGIDAAPPGAWPPASSSALTSLTLDYCVVTAEALGPLLASTQRLRAFTYRLGSALVSDEQVSLPDVYAALARHAAPTLEALCLDVRDYDGVDEAGLIPLLSFTKLRSLRASRCLLVPRAQLDEDPASLVLADGPAACYGRRVGELPASLEEVAVFGSSSHDHADGRDVLRFVRAMCGRAVLPPALREVDLRQISAADVPGEVYVELAGETRAMCEEVGVRLLVNEQFSLGVVGMGGDSISS